MLTPTFRLFESVCNELAGAESVVITRDDFLVDGAEAPLMDDLDLEYHRSDDGALNDAVASLSKHFARLRGSIFGKKQLVWINNSEREHVTCTIRSVQRYLLSRPTNI